MPRTGRWWDTLRERLVAFDAQLAHDALSRFEARAGVTLAPVRVRAASLDAVLTALRPEGRPLVEHHWATWCESCLPELPRIEALAARLDGIADVVGVSWDRFDAPDDDLDASVARVADTVAAQRASWPTLVLDATPEAAFAALSLPVRTVPQTRVLDADGGVLKVYTGPLRTSDVEAIATLLAAG
ncbi:MAG: TlpA family protein disulfide reductase [Alphaproteobacteria bacterium]|nr:TlpA family protein disulfide reductase [Alphaproteobacteria bacterium]